LEDGVGIMKHRTRKKKDSVTNKELARVYRAVYYGTKKYGWVKKEELIKKGYSEEAINILLRYGVIFEPREGYLKPT
jgi:hypothetical protein